MDNQFELDILEKIHKEEERFSDEVYEEMKRLLNDENFLLEHRKEQKKIQLTS